MDSRNYLTTYAISCHPTQQVGQRSKQLQLNASMVEISVVVTSHDLLTFS